MADAESTANPPAAPVSSGPKETEQPIDASSSGQTVAVDTSKLIIGVAVVDFNHLVGPQVEYAFPKELLQDETMCTNLPFLALPDGSHLSDEDFCYFHLYCPKTLPGNTIFGISCNRQISSAALTKKGVEVTRSTVQKAVVVLARQPVFGPIREKLGIVTRAYFAQGDLTDTDILVEFQNTLEAGLRQGLGQSLKEANMVSQEGETTPGGESATPFIEDSDSTMSMGTSLRQLIFQWRFKTLQLLKLLLLQRRVMFFGYPIERLCTYQYSLISLLPGLLVHLEDCGAAELKSSQAPRQKIDHVKTSDKDSLLKYMGYPLPIFGEDAFFQPYLPLQQIDTLKANSWLVGTSNGVFRSQKDCAIDVIVDLEHASVEFMESSAPLKLQNVVALTAADRKWMDEIVNTVIETWDPANPSRPTTLQFKGSDDYIRMKFQSYISSMLAATKASNDAKGNEISDPQTIAAFGTDFIAQFKLTQAYASWNEWTDDKLYNVVPARHPCEGKTSVVEDVGLRLTAGLHDLNLEGNLAPTREAIGKGLTAGSAALSAGGANFYRLASNARNDFGKQIAAFNARSASGSQPSASGSQSGDASSTTTGPGFQIPPNLQKNANEAAQAASAAAAQAATQARAALGSFGSFLSAKQKQWAGSRTPSEPSTPTGTVVSGEGFVAITSAPPPPAKPTQ